MADRRRNDNKNETARKCYACNYQGGRHSHTCQGTKRANTHARAPDENVKKTLAEKDARLAKIEEENSRLKAEKEQMSKEIAELKAMHGQRSANSGHDVKKLAKDGGIQASNHAMLVEKVEMLQREQQEMQSKLIQVIEKQNNYEAEKEQLHQRIEILEKQRMKNKIEQKKQRAEIDALKQEIRKIEKAMQDSNEKEKKVRDEYGRRIARLEEEAEKFATKEGLQNMLREKNFNPEMTFPIHDEEILQKIRTIVVQYVIPDNVIHHFHRYNQDVLLQQDIEVVTAVTTQKGICRGAAELLNLVIRYKDWFSCLLQVLRDPHVKQGHVADLIWDALGMRHTKEKNLAIEQVKEKIRRAVKTLDKLQAFYSEDGLVCLKFICDTFYDYPECRRDISDLLADLNFAEICLKILREVPDYSDLENDQVYEAIKDTCQASCNYSVDSPKFVASLVKSGAVRNLTDILSHTPLVKNLDKERQCHLVKSCIILLLHIAIDVKDSRDFRIHNTVQTLKKLTESNNEIIKVRAMMTIARMVEEDDEDALSDTTGVIKITVQLTDKALTNKDRKYEDMTPAGLTTLLTYLAVNEDNGRKMVNAGALNVLLKMLKHTNPHEQGWAANCLWKLARYASIRKDIQKYPGLVSTLEHLGGSNNEGVGAHVKQALRYLRSGT